MRYPFKGHLFFRRWLLITTCNQPAGAPFIDRAWSGTQEGGQYECRAILLTPWRRDRYGDAVGQRALVIGRRKRREPTSEPTGAVNLHMKAESPRST